MKKSFTLIEMIVVIGVIGMALPIFFTIILAIFQQQTRIYALQEIKRQGDDIITSINNTVKNSAMEIYSERTFSNQKCNLATAPNNTFSSSTGTDFFFKDRLGNWFNFYLNGTTNIASNSATTPIIFNNDKVTISNFSISCYRRGIYASPVVSLNFTVNYGATTTSLNYKTKVKLRSY